MVIIDNEKNIECKCINMKGMNMQQRNSYSWNMLENANNNILHMKCERKQDLFIICIVPLTATNGAKMVNFW